ncbi:MAG: hypothetical protein ACRC7S_14565 [Cetobacterium sp.]
MAGIKGQKSGGFGGRKKLSPNLKKSERITFRCTTVEKERIAELNAEVKINFAEVIIRALEKLKEDE